MKTKSRRGVATPLTAADVRRILEVCSPDGVLVGGQALAFWADHLQVRLPADLQSGVTADADFIGDATLARRLGKALGWKVWLPALDDATPQTGKVTHALQDGGIKQVDFLSGVVGLTTKDLLRRAVEVKIEGIGTLRVLHPLDVLDSRIQNLNALAEKRTEAGVAQARLAVDVVRALVRRQIALEGERIALRLLERIVEISADIAAVRVFLLYGIDPLQAVPLEEFRTTTALHQRRWPQIEADIAARRETLRKSLDRKPR